MRRFAFALLAGAFLPSLAPAQGFGVYEHGTCTMGRAGVAAARPCTDGSAIFFNPAGLAGLAGNRAALGVTLIGASGSFTDDFLGRETELDNPLIPVPNLYLTHAFSPKLTAGIGVFAPYGLETNWPTDFDGRFVGYNTDLKSIYIQPTIGYQLHDRLKVGIGLAFIHSTLELHQRADFSTQTVPGQPFTFASLGIPTGTDFADAELTASGNGYAVNFGAILRVNDRLTIGGHWLTRKTIEYDGDAAFAQVATGLVLPPGHRIQLPPVCDTLTACNVDNITGTLFLPGQALSNGAVSTSITMPPQGTLGFAYDLSPDWTIMADYHLVVWGWFSTVAIDFENPGTPDFELHPNNEDTHGFRFGTEYRTSPTLTLRGGYLYHSAASPPEFVTPLLPEAARNEFTIGAGIVATPKLNVDLGYQYIRQNDRRGLVNTSAGNTGLYKFSAHLFGLGVAYTF